MIRERPPVVLPLHAASMSADRVTARISTAIALFALLYFLGQFARAWVAGRLG